MQIAVLGAGAIGCYLGGCLVTGGATVHFIGREPVKEAIASNGLTLTDWKGRKSLIRPENTHFFTDPEVLSSADVILVTVKGTGTDAAAKQLVAYAKPTALIISFQNGIQNIKKLKACLPGHTILAGMVPFNVLNENNNRFHCGTEGNIAMQTCAGAERQIVNAFKNGGLIVDTYHDFEAVQWGKLILNLNNSINALAGIPLVDELKDKNYRYVLAKSIQEALDTFKVAGIQPKRMGKVIPHLIPRVLLLPTWLFTRVAATMLKIDPQARSSMQDDLEKKRQTEIDLLNGEIITLAMDYNVSVPVNEAIILLIKQAEADRQGSPRLTGRQLKEAIMH